MTVRTTIPALALLAGAILLAACGGGTAATAPGATQAAAATSTQAPAATDAGIPSFVLPSFHANSNLEKLIPTEVGGEPITTMSVSGADLIGLGSSEVLSSVLTALGKQPSDLSAAFGGNSLIEIVAFQINGESGSQILDAFNAQSQSDSIVSDASFGGKSVKKIAPSGGGDATYVYTKDDVIFSVTGSDITDALLNEAFSKLP
jgi:hypothetical protein